MGYIAGLSGVFTGSLRGVSGWSRVEVFCSLALVYPPHRPAPPPLAVLLGDFDSIGLLSFDLCVGGCDSWQMASESGVSDQSDLNKGKQIHNLSQAWIHNRHKERLLLERKTDFLFAARCLLIILVKDVGRKLAVGSLPPISTDRLHAHFQFWRATTTYYLSYRRFFFCQ